MLIYSMMKLSLILIIITSSASANDIAVIHGPGILIIKNATKSSLDGHDSLYTEFISINISNLAYPIALGYDAEEKNFFISDANNKNTEIFSLSVNLINSSILHPFIVQMRHSSIQAMVIDHLTRSIYWTDSAKHGIYYASIKNTTYPFHSKLLYDSNVLKPRSISVNSCHKTLYWTESMSKGTSSIMIYQLNSNSSKVFKEGHNNTFFQGIHYNVFHNKLIWAETTSESQIDNCSCKIIVKSLDNNEEITAVNESNCFPFSIVSDENFIYWSDWSRQGIMRAPIENGNSNIVDELVSTPPIMTKEGIHNGAFGIALMEESLDYSSLCSKKYFSSKSPIENMIFKQDDIVITTENTHFDFNVPLENQSNKHTCDEFYYMKVIIIVLGVVCILLAITSCSVCGLALSKKIYKKFLNSKLATTPIHKLKVPKVHRTFNPKSKLSSTQLCPREANDGVRIEIEDCCQMTLCDKPCYTRMKKESKDYVRSSKKSSDKINLLSSPEASF